MGKPPVLGSADGEAAGEGDGDTAGEGDGDTAGEGDGDTAGEGDGDTAGEGDGDGDAVAVKAPAGSVVCVGTAANAVPRGVSGPPPAGLT